MNGACRRKMKMMAFRAVRNVNCETGDGRTMRANKSALNEKCKTKFCYFHDRFPLCFRFMFALCALHFFSSYKNFKNLRQIKKKLLADDDEKQKGIELVFFQPSTAQQEISSFHKSLLFFCSMSRSQTEQECCLNSWLLMESVKKLFISNNCTKASRLGLLPHRKIEFKSYCE